MNASGCWSARRDSLLTCVKWSSHFTEIEIDVPWWWWRGTHVEANIEYLGCRLHLQGCQLILQGCQRLLTGRVHICFQLPRFPQPWQTPFKAGQTRRFACGVRPHQKEGQGTWWAWRSALATSDRVMRGLWFINCRGYLVGGVLEVVSCAEPSVKVTNFRNDLCKRQRW